MNLKDFINKEKLRKEPQKGDEVELGNFRLTYDVREGVEGWAIRYINSVNPAKDVVMPDEYMGKPIMFANLCFKDIYNVASVAHISTPALEGGHIENMFMNSGIRELPKQLFDCLHTKPELIQSSCKFACALTHLSDIDKVLRSYSLDGIALFEKQRDLEEKLEIAKTIMERDRLKTDTDFPSFKKAGTIDFMLNGKKQVITFAVDENGKNYAVSPDGPIKYLYEGETKDSVFVPFDMYVQTKFGVSPYETTARKLTPMTIKDLDTFVSNFYNNYIIDIQYDLKKEEYNVAEVTSWADRTASYRQQEQRFEPSYKFDASDTKSNQENNFEER